MMRTLYMLTFIMTSMIAMSQSENCNSLGVWLWHLEGTDYPSYVNLANDLSQLGVKRIYVKVADGRLDSIKWPEVTDTDIVQIFDEKGIDAWAWSYNYPGNDSLQAEALYVAAHTGYKGFVIDLESEFDGETVVLQHLVNAFYNARNRALQDEIVQDSMPLYATTWGNPKDHNFHVEILDAYIDGHMPQTYLENWGTSYLEDPKLWVERGNAEYRELGAVKPIHHIISMEKGNVTADHVNTFFAASGPMSTIWRIPGGGTPLSIRDVWTDVNWDVEFCGVTSVDELTLDDKSIVVFPNPFTSRFTIDCPIGSKIMMYNELGQIVYHGQAIEASNLIETHQLEKGYYLLKVIKNEHVTSQFVIKM